MTKSTRAWQLILLFGLGLSPVPWTFAAGAHFPKSPRACPLGLHRPCRATSQAGANAGQADVRPDLIIVQAPVVRPGPITHRFPQGSHLVRLAPSEHSAPCLTPDFFAAADPRTSFDGARVLFAGKKTPESPWQIWEMNADGANVRQITHCASDCLKSAYLPRGQIVYTSLPAEPAGGTAHGIARQLVPTSTDLATRKNEASQIWVCNMDGSDAHPITFGPGDFQVETVLKNGMILATARSPLLPASGLPADRELYTLRPDGTGLGTLRCDHQHPAIRSQAQELDDGAVVFVKASLSSGNSGGNLAWIRRGALHNSPLTVPSIVASAPQPLAADQLLVARESATGPTSGKKLTLYAFDASAGKFVTPIYQDPNSRRWRPFPWRPTNHRAGTGARSTPRLRGATSFASTVTWPRAFPTAELRPSSREFAC